MKASLLFLLTVKCDCDVEDCVNQQCQEWFGDKPETCKDNAHDGAQQDVDDWFAGSCSKRKRDWGNSSDEWCRESSETDDSCFDIDDELSRLDEELFREEPRHQVKQNICLEPKVKKIMQDTEQYCAGKGKDY